MKILHITNAYPYTEYTSFGIFVKEQIKSLDELGIINDVFFINAKKNGLSEYYKQRKELSSIIRNFKPDIIHCHHEFTTLLLFFIKPTEPIILSLLGDITKRSILNKMVFKLSTLKVKRVILKNKSSENPFYRYIPNGVDINFFKPIKKIEAKERLNLEPTVRYVLFVTASVNNPIKRYDKYVAVLNELNNPEAIYSPLIMSGVPREQVPYYFNASEFLLLTSDHEGSPNAVKEAMACNLPVVSTNVGNVKDLFGNSAGNYISDSGSVKNLVLLSKKAIQSSLSEGRKRIKEIGLDMITVAQEIEDLYKEVLK